MANVVINDTNLVNIADAIREKNGTEDTYKPSEMAEAILAIESGGSGDIDPVVLTGDQSYGCCGELSAIVVQNFPNKITTNNIIKAEGMFLNSSLTNVPFELNFISTGDGQYANKMFKGSKIKRLPVMNNFKPVIVGNMFEDSEIETITDEDVENWDFTNLGYLSSSQAYLFSCARWLKTISTKFLNGLSYNKQYYYYPIYSSLFSHCNTLNEVIGLGVCDTTYTSNVFSYTFTECKHLKRLTFATQEDGSPYVVKWRNQTIDLSSYVGYGLTIYDANTYGLPLEAEVKRGSTGTINPEVRELYPDDWWTENKLESRYNLASAIETINSLPDASAYLSGTTYTNTIKFGGQGSVNDGTYIGDMTAEQIAVATTKGWTVVLS